MKKWNSMFRLCVVALVVAGFAAAASAETRYRSRQSGDWADPGTWQVFDAEHGWRASTKDDGVPGPSDWTEIQPGHSVLVSGRTQIETLVINRSSGDLGPGMLEIVSGGWITIRRQLKMPQRPRESQAGRIVFSGAGAQPGVLESRAPLAIGGDVIVSGAAGGEIRTRNPAHLLSFGRFSNVQVTEGPLTVSGSVSMDGTVELDGPTELRVQGRNLRDGSSGTWYVKNSRARLTIATDEPVALRAGTIRLARGTLDVAVDMKTDGSVIRGSEARINVDPGRTFEAPQLIDVDESRSTNLQAIKRERQQ